MWSMFNMNSQSKKNNNTDIKNWKLKYMWIYFKLVHLGCELELKFVPSSCTSLTRYTILEYWPGSPTAMINFSVRPQIKTTTKNAALDHPRSPFHNFSTILTSIAGSNILFKGRQLFWPLSSLRQLPFVLLKINDILRFLVFTLNQPYRQLTWPNLFILVFI